jgi:hypothetical protein
LEWILYLLDTLFKKFDSNLQWRYRQFIITVSSAIVISHSLSAVHYTCTESSRYAVPHHSSGTGFQRRTFAFLGSRTVPAIPTATLNSISILDCLLLLSGALSNNWFQPEFVSITKKKKKLNGLSPRANYTDRATGACRRSDCQLLRIKGATWSA